MKNLIKSLFSRFRSVVEVDIPDKDRRLKMFIPGDVVRVNSWHGRRISERPRLDFVNGISSNGEYSLSGSSWYDDEDLQLVKRATRRKTYLALIHGKYLSGNEDDEEKLERIQRIIFRN